MKVVIQCAASKQPAAASFLAAGRTVRFVARPDLAPRDAALLYARPDDSSDDGRTWRQRLLAYNRDGGRNPSGLLRAYQLYRRDTYHELVDRFGSDQVFILSAGWGLIRADFLTPMYDITFTAQAPAMTRRRKEDAYEDFRLVPDDGDDIVFFGGKDYLPLFCAVTEALKGHKTVVFNSAAFPELPPGFAAVRYQTARRTNWHYEAARALIGGELRLRR